MSDAPARLALVRAALAKAERAAGRPEGETTLIAVSKTFDAADILPVLEAGQRTFGENRVQESQAKWPELKAQFQDVELHLIGPLQSNKTAEAVALFDAIHTVDRPKIAQAIAKEMAAQGRSLKLFVQVNVGSEPQKAGVDPEDADAFVAQCRDAYGLEIEGLMCIPPVDEPPAPYFALLDQIARRNGLKGLSMGMSSDFADAVPFGATHVRVGSAIFGTRPKPE
ncbi:pyridoxal phosphate enzyme (YggS family) [Methylopila capsulata]|uniref:Pyridoxal phosphate homeostasis protein n=1 Tax=Methylopila capsulata TaxID=61654 RepID=A0A9W6ITQ7_9HYPH|nr:YggS family pyridoxal phosphate-dependent enzyme [Methylopila capsulata]MBM7851871.1 pyridoxal phosphate enzyme (YggS family) [Methylopila capsulata]GLK54936.1 YggS family pyridoxal phosphate enzyme [Methylopila capsulata]